MTDWRDDVNFGGGIRQVLIHEGGYSDHPNDAGGVTKFGISLRYLRDAGHALGDVDRDGDIDADDIRALDRDGAIGIYYHRFWLPNQYGRMPPQIAHKAFDLAVVMGPRQANKLLQRALAVVETDDGQRSNVADDGQIGRQTLLAVRDRSSPAAAYAVRCALRASSEMFFRWLAEVEPGNKPFLNGWIWRARW
ncbi:MAG: hypothetical protein CL558_12965 [Alphaproteobacteria bacterium]|nr:hypothetical protein [Alphaproteobacteria bacterium]OUT41977.1 MAG: hypothetical protein CBB62_06620 [Micavibrio sp. TMED2]MAS46427.1 hypothetical protein [Alphaproteobacteria bacterium]MAX94522.1 hypothetical protein [Alphaproteobacteria bacterium]MAX97097.1 hypothetical protein [Alphaproteobacteria bacterium]|tara:strand:- start:29404 stop:29982 length:579 start_codon:yes stop_codon:yes gene_type:complete